MPKIKMKSNKGAAKRFKLTATGKVKRSRGGKSHLNIKKDAKRRRRLVSADYLEGAAAKRIRTYLPYI